MRIRIRLFTLMRIRIQILASKKAGSWAQWTGRSPGHSMSRWDSLSSVVWIRIDLMRIRIRIRIPMRIRILLRAGAGPGAGRRGQAGRLSPGPSMSRWGCVSSVLWIRIKVMQIRIQHVFLVVNPDPDPNADPVPNPGF
jgi:hypothetical protein